MTIILTDFQQRAAAQLVAHIKDAQENYAFKQDLLAAVVLEAATGAGKTVIATSVIEQLMFGSDSTEPVSGTTILWVTNDPNLNAQTARKMQDASKRINDIRLLGQGAAFNQEIFEPGVIYFLNTQAASATARIARKGDGQDWTIWQTIENTIDQLGARFLVIVDEAHYGVTDKAGGAPTIINRILNGDPGSDLQSSVRKPVPVFVGISATAERLNKALEQQNRRRYNVTVPIEEVRSSGLVKDRITLAPAAMAGEVVADTTFIRLGVDKTLEYERRWAEYAASQDEPAVIPAMVIQLPDERSEDDSFKTLLRSVVDSVLQQWPALIALQIVHTFGEHTPIDLGGGRAIRYMAPQDIQDATEVRVVLAKNAITTGWDCPRAEVLVSLRASTDFTPIAQLIGRIVRQPMARRIALDETLNNVHAYLPRFDRKTVMSVVSQFSTGDTATSAEVIRLELPYRAPGHMQPALQVLASLPSYSVPSQISSPETKRLHTLATYLENDALLPGAVTKAVAYLNGILDIEAAKLFATGELDKRREAVSNASVFELQVSVDGSVIDGERILAGTRMDAKNIDDVFRRASRALKDGTAESYWAYLVNKDPDEDPIEAKITVAALGLSPQLVENVEAAAASMNADWLKTHAKEISFQPESVRARYSRLQSEARDPQLVPRIEVGGTVVDAVTQNTDSDLTDEQVRADIAADTVNRWAKHLYQDPADGRYWKKPQDSDGLERRVLETELASNQLVAWYRNPVGGERALCIPYRTRSTGKWARLFPDFVFFHETPSGLKPSILDPHGIHLTDWIDKLTGYLDYADKHASEFRGIAPLTKLQGKEMFLPVHDAIVRAKIRSAVEAGDSIEEIFIAHGVAY
ncbi:DEAD/DEAH box helicase [Microbacterium sp. OR16]|uniref:DEAD/DEAH box helicase n=1 Tax=Microbacterium sp. OR16 TaxID=3095345 RepID=UPI0039B6DD64